MIHRTQVFDDWFDQSEFKDQRSALFYPLLLSWSEGFDQGQLFVFSLKTAKRMELLGYKESEAVFNAKCLELFNRWFESSPFKDQRDALFIAWNLAFLKGYLTRRDDLQAEEDNKDWQAFYWRHDGGI